jgi:D-beta-D-heptose 7-phosphate kinase/D-beta-D-heptose 1-phosphate adenosyltransferase
MRVVVISGYFNPLHTGHLDYIKGASELGDKLVVIINNDQQVGLKGSAPFMKEADRMRIVSAIKGVDRVVLSIDTDSSVVQTISLIYNEYAVNWDFDTMTFGNGGDRGKDNSPEESYCNWRKIKTVYSVGGNKTQSSSGLIDNATKNVDKDKE